MTRDSAIFDFRRPIPDRNSVNDPATGLTLRRRRLAAPHHAPATQMRYQLPLQDATGLDEQTSVNRLVGHAHCRILTILERQPARDLLRRPIVLESRGNKTAKSAMASKMTRLGALR
jgi:hypothetical protein